MPSGGRWAAKDVEGIDLATRLFAQQVERGIPEQWATLLAVEQVAREVRDEFQDEAVIPDALQSLLAGARRKLEELRDEAPRYVGPIEVREVDDSVVERLRAGVRRDETLYL